MTKRIHTNGNYTTVGMIEVMNEPVRSGKWQAEATDMRKNFYPKAFHRIQAMEGYLDVAESDRLHIQFMVQLSTTPWRILANTHSRASHGVPEILENTSPKATSSSSTPIAT